MRAARTGALGALGAAAALLAAAAATGLDRPPGLGDVREVRHWSYEGYTRVVVELTRAVESEAHRLPADPQAGRPERLYLDLAGVWIGKRYAEPIPVGDGLLRAVRLGQNTRTRTRLVIDLRRYGGHRVFFLSDPSRVVVDVYADPQRLRAHERMREDGPALPLELRPVRTVVLDPGHGGRDPGATGLGGLQEKDVTLRLARALRERLEGRGFRVELTRSGDETLDLEERTAFAEGVGGDLFVSLHANASRRRAAEGLETYYLDEGYERNALRVAARENGVPPNSLDRLQRTVAELRLSVVSDQSARLASTVQEAMVRGVRHVYGSVEDLGTKQGPFYVLFLARMPAVLVEAGFLTNPQEARRLRSDLYLEVLAERIARGLSRYRSGRHTLFAEGSP